MTTTPTIDRLKADGGWNPDWDLLSQWDPAWTESFLTAAVEPWAGGVLPRKTIEFLCIAGNASCTHLYEPGLRRHLRAALALGATRDEILAVLKLASTIGLQACELGAPMLDAAEADSGRTEGADDCRLWNPHCTGDWSTLASIVCGSGVLDAKTVELIGVALNAAATHLHAPALRRHMQAALDAGASRAEILEVLKVASVIGIHSCAFAVPILAAELAAREHGAG